MRDFTRSILTFTLGIIIAALVIIGLFLGVNSLRKNDKDKMNNEQFTTIEQSDDLWLQYDKDTNIVFMVQKSASYGRGAYIRIPYIADNGLPYTYNKETQLLEKIIHTEIEED